MAAGVDKSPNLVIVPPHDDHRNANERLRKIVAWILDKVLAADTVPGFHEDVLDFTFIELWGKVALWRQGLGLTQGPTNAFVSFLAE